MKRFLKFLLLVIIVAAYGCRGNMMPNPGAEEVGKSPEFLKLNGTFFGPEIPVNGWKIKKSCGIAEFGATDKERHSGRFSVYCKVIKKNKNDRFLFFVITGQSLPLKDREFKELKLKPDTAYYFSCWVKAKGRFIASGRYKETYADSKDKLKHMGIKGHPQMCPVNEWRKYEAVFATSPEMKTCAPILQVLNTDFTEEGDEIFIDDVVIVPFEEIDDTCSMTRIPPVKSK
jgi:hypothetical protein